MLDPCKAFFSDIRNELSIFDERNAAVVTDVDSQNVHFVFPLSDLYRAVGCGRG